MMLSFAVEAITSSICARAHAGSVQGHLLYPITSPESVGLNYFAAGPAGVCPEDDDVRKASGFKPTSKP
jgi:hypothetical protein